MRIIGVAEEWSIEASNELQLFSDLIGKKADEPLIPFYSQDLELHRIKSPEKHEILKRGTLSLAASTGPEQREMELVGVPLCSQSEIMPSGPNC